MSQKTSQKKEAFGDLNPWSEPAWYNVLSSPYYNESHRKLRRFVRDYMNENVMDFAEEWEESGEIPKEAKVKFARAGLAFHDIPAKYRPGVSLPAGIPEEEWDIFHDLVLQDERGRLEAGVSAGIGTASGIGAPPIVRFGTEKQKDQWLPGIFTGETAFCLGATEPTGGSDLANLKTTAVKSECGKFYVVNGHKKWITSVMSSTHMTTAVRTGGPGARGVSVLVIPTNTPGFTTKKIKNTGANAGGSAWVTMENCRVPAENLIGKENEGFKVLMSNFNKERFAIAVIMNRKTRTCLSTALAYAHERETFGQPLIANQVIRTKFATIARYVESHWAWLEQLAYHVKVNGWTDDLASRLALAKVQGGRMLELANREAQQVLGGAGYQKGGVGSSVEQIGRDLRMLVVGGGSEEIISDLAVRQELALSRRLGAKI